MRAGLVVIVVVCVARLMMVMTADWLHAWPFPIGRSRDWWKLSGCLGGLLTGWMASLVTVALDRRGLCGRTCPVSGPEDVAARLVGRAVSDVQGENGLILIVGDCRVIITSADPYQPLAVVVRSSQAGDDWEAGL
jgi:hypothetical protein